MAKTIKELAQHSASGIEHNLYPDFTLTVDNCGQEPVHRPVAIQDQGHMLVIDTAATPSLHAMSDQLAVCLGCAADSVWHQSDFHWLPASIQNLIADAGSSQRHPRLLNSTVVLANQAFHVSHHRHDDKLTIEFEPDGDTDVDDQFMLTAAQEFRRINELDSLYAQATQLFAEAFGYDRVMIYQFDHDQHGCVVGEHKANTLEPYLGLHYPETDIPKIARDLFLLTKSRSIPDVNARYTPLLFNPSLGANPPHLDLSFSQLRATSPIHISYLKNMGVAATLTFSIVIDGKLWGLVAAHHYMPRLALFHHKQIGEVIADLLAKRILEVEAEVKLRLETAARAAESRLLKQLRIRDSYRVEVMAPASVIDELCAADGAALITLDQCIYATGIAPAYSTLLAIRDWLVNEEHFEVFSTGNFDKDIPVLIDKAAPIGGILATCISRSSKSYLFWFRQPVSQTVNWAGDPKNSVSVEPSEKSGPIKLMPRQSFAKWQISTVGQSLPWENPAHDMADRIRQGVFKIELRHTAMLVERNNKEFTQLTFTAAHDLREPLRTQSNFIELLDQSLKAQDYDEIPYITKRLESATMRMSTLVSDLLDYSRVSIENKREEVNLTDLVSEIRDELELKIKETKTILNVDELPTIRGDRSKLWQCLENLITNAIKYVPADVSPVINIYIEQENEFFTINVKDNGIGIDPKFHSKIFVMFQRLHGRDEYNGTGIGLAICAKVAESMGADIGVTSTPGGGANFWLRIHNSQIVIIE